MSSQVTTSSKKSGTDQKFMRYSTKRVAHFLLIPELLYSPPNNAIINAYLTKGYHVDIFSPGSIESITAYGDKVRTFAVGYSWLWMIKNIFNLKWMKYSWISGTSEDPLAIVAVLSFLYKKKSFTLVDEIKAGSYRGDRSNQWKAICKWAIRRAEFKIVNDRHRVQLLRDYAELTMTDKIIVYPGCYSERPKAKYSSDEIKKRWGFPDNAFVIGSSGGFNLTAGADWLLNSVKEIQDIYAVIQPLGVSELSLFLLESLHYKHRLFIQKERVGWLEAWKTSIGFDVGLSIYSNPAPQFQNMGISSNRLCMYIAMGVPVVASHQKSFQFLEEYECGILVSSYSEFKMAIQEIRNKQPSFRDNCEKCFTDYIQPKQSYNLLLSSLDLSSTKK